MKPPPQPVHTTQMSHRPLTPPPTLVTSEQYNAVLSRLDAEIHTRAQLEADLVTARDELVHLRHQLAHHPQPPSHPTSFHLQERPSMDDNQPSHFTPTQPQKDDVPMSPALVSNKKPAGHDKEILSHCSDISGCKSGIRTPDSGGLKKSTQRKSSNNLVNMAGVTKKSKSKKERAAKVKIPGQSRYWTPDEHKLFLEALNKYGHKDLRSISAYVGTRNMTQVRTHSQKYFMRLMREAKRQNPVGTKSATNSSDEVVAPTQETSAVMATASILPRAPSATSTRPQAGETSTGEGRVDNKDADNGDKYSVPNTCGMTLLCLVGQDTLPA